MLQVVTYDPLKTIENKLNDEYLWNNLNHISYLGVKPPLEIEFGIINHNIDVVLAVTDSDHFTKNSFILNLLENYSDVYVVIISNNTEYEEVRHAFLMGAFDYIVNENIESRLMNCFIRMAAKQKDIYFSSKINNKVHVLVKHIFDGGDNVENIVKDIIDNIYRDWANNAIACQQVIERVKIESYKNFVNKKSWLKNFIYRGNYIREIGFEIKEKNQTEQELCRYYSEVNNLFKKYNVIDVNKTIYTIGKSVINHVDEKVTLESVANDVYLNKSYISYIFKKMTGISFNDFVIDVKIDRAKALLHNNELSIGEVSEKLYFCNTGYFSSMFKKNLGLTPTEYKKSFKG